MELILKSKGRKFVCTYDSEDHELISRYNWQYHNGYARAGKILMHRLILGLKDPSINADHVNHDRLNNTRANLRACNKSENQWNRLSQGGSSKFKGVTRFEGSYFSQIRCNGEYHYLGLFRSEVTAAKIYDKAARELHGEFASLNFNEATKEPEQLTINI